MWNEDSGMEAIYDRWLKKHIRSRRGESRRRIQPDLGHSEKQFVTQVWLPAFGHLDGLHPEYEVRDFKDGTRFLDFAYIRPGIRVCIEIDPFGTHGRDVDRWQHDDNLERQNDLMIDNWKILRYSLDRIKKFPRQVQQKLHLAMSKWGVEKKHRHFPNPIDQAIINLLIQRETALSPSEVSRTLGWSRSAVSRHLKILAGDGFIFPTKIGLRKVIKYSYNRSNE